VLAAGRILTESGNESVGTLIAGFPAGGPQPPILPPSDGFLLLDRDKFQQAAG
jgi:hypothetical protein